MADAMTRNNEDSWQMDTILLEFSRAFAKVFHWLLITGVTKDAKINAYTLHMDWKYKDTCFTKALLGFGTFSGQYVYASHTGVFNRSLITMLFWCSRLISAGASLVFFTRPIKYMDTYKIVLRTSLIFTPYLTKIVDDSPWTKITKWDSRFIPLYSNRTLQINATISSGVIAAVISVKGWHVLVEYITSISITVWHLFQIQTDKILTLSVILPRLVGFEELVWINRGFTSTSSKYFLR